MVSGLKMDCAVQGFGFEKRLCMRIRGVRREMYCVREEGRVGRNHSGMIFLGKGMECVIINKKVF